MRDRFTAKRHLCPISHPPSRFITIPEKCPPQSLQGQVVKHYFLKGVHVRARVVEARSLEGEGLKLDSKEARWNYERMMVTATLLGQWRRETDEYSRTLTLVTQPDRLIPPAPHFISIGAASPFFRTPELLVYHKDVSEPPWTEQNFLSNKGIPLVDKQEIREGSLIRLFDPALAQRFQGKDSSELFGQVKHFIGFTTDHAIALIDIHTFYRSGRLVSYASGNFIHPKIRPYEETIILLARSRCRFEPISMLRYWDEEFSVSQTHTLLQEERLIGRGPKREWPKRGGGKWGRKLMNHKGA